MTGRPFIGVYTPSEEEKKHIESEVSALYDLILHLAKKLIELQTIYRHEGYLKIYLENKFKTDFYLEVWHEPSYPATFFKIRVDETNLEVARIIFEDIPSVDYSYT